MIDSLAAQAKLLSSGRCGHHGTPTESEDNTSRVFFSLFLSLLTPLLPSICVPLPFQSFVVLPLLSLSPLFHPPTPMETLPPPPAWSWALQVCGSLAKDKTEEPISHVSWSAGLTLYGSRVWQPVCKVDRHSCLSLSCLWQLSRRYTVHAYTFPVRKAQPTQ